MKTVACTRSKDKNSLMAAMLSRNRSSQDATHRLVLLLSYLICSYFAVFSLVQILTIMIPPTCFVPLET